MAIVGISLQQGVVLRMEPANACPQKLANSSQYRDHDQECKRSQLAGFQA